jgi:hypothetical protein
VKKLKKVHSNLKIVAWLAAAKSISERVACGGRKNYLESGHFHCHSVQK